MEKVIFNITEAAEEYADGVGYSMCEPEEAFIAGAKWAFDMIKQHGVGGYIADIETITEEHGVDDE